MDRSQVAEHYRARGYQIRENAKLRGKSGDVHGVELVAEGPMGALVISFGDVAGVDAPEMGSIRRVARDVGATPVLAASTFTNDLRHLAPQLGVVLIDDAVLSQPAPPVPPSSWPGAAPNDARADLEAHPWPASGRYKPADPVSGKKAVEVDELIARLDEKPKPTSPGDELWPLRSGGTSQEGAAAAASPSTATTGLAGDRDAAPQQFDWLGKQVAQVPAASQTMTVVDEADDAAPHEATRSPRVALPIIEAPKRWVLRTLLYAFATAFFLWLLLR